MGVYTWLHVCYCLFLTSSLGNKLLITLNEAEHLLTLVHCVNMTMSGASWI